jgi:hypothetical protein
MRVDPAEMIGLTGIARRYGVTRAAVSNWRKRYADFPLPIFDEGGKTSPVFYAPSVRVWAEGHGKRPTTETETQP